MSTPANGSYRSSASSPRSRSIGSPSGKRPSPPRPVLPPRADGAEARLGIAADRLAAGGRRVNRDPVVTALPVQRSSVWLPEHRSSLWLPGLCPFLLPGCVLAPGPTALAERRPRGPGSILSAFAQQAGRNRDRPPIGPVRAPALGRAIMAKTTTNKAKAAAARPSVAAKKSTTPKQKGAAARTADLSEEVLKTVEGRPAGRDRGGAKVRRHRRRGTARDR